MNTDQAKLDNANYLEKEAQEMYTAEQRAQNRERFDEANREFIAGKNLA